MKNIYRNGAFEDSIINLQLSGEYALILTKGSNGVLYAYPSVPDLVKSTIEQCLRFPGTEVLRAYIGLSPEFIDEVVQNVRILNTGKQGHCRILRNTNSIAEDLDALVLVPSAGAAQIPAENISQGNV